MIQDTMKSYSMKWAEAERELAVRRIVLPTYPIQPEHPVIQKEEIYLPQIPDKPYPTNLPRNT